MINENTVTKDMSEQTELEKTIRTMTEKSNCWGYRVNGFVNEIKEICIHYADRLGYEPVDVFNALEGKRTYSYPNYYQWANFPKLDTVKIFKNLRKLKNTIQPEKGFRCPACQGISKDPYTCDNNKRCGWTSSSLFGTLNKGIRLIVVEEWLENPIVYSCFMPISME